MTKNWTDVCILFRSKSCTIRVLEGNHIGDNTCDITSENTSEVTPPTTAHCRLEYELEKQIAKMDLVEVDLIMVGVSFPDKIILNFSLTKLSLCD